jgi:NADH:ubiquinone oxidoreductase subunit E
MQKNLSIVVCTNRRYGVDSPSCAASGGVAIASQLEVELREAGLAVEVRRIECLGQCERGPNLRIAPGGEFFYEMTLEQIPQVIDRLRRLSEQK